MMKNNNEIDLLLKHKVDQVTKYVNLRGKINILKVGIDQNSCGNELE